MIFISIKMMCMLKKKQQMLKLKLDITSEISVKAAIAGLKFPVAK